MMRWVCVLISLRAGSCVVRSLLLALVLALASVSGAAAKVKASPAEAPPHKLTLILDWFINPNHAPIVIADAEGLFARHGLDVTIIAPADPNDAPKLVAAGKADLGVGYQTQLHLQVAAGLPLVRVGVLIDKPLNTLTVLEDSGIRSIADLKGRKIGYSVGGVEEALLKTVLTRHGLSLADVQLVNVNFALSPALLSRQVDAVVGAYRNFELPQLALEGHPGRAFFFEDEGVPMRDELIFIANPARLNPVVVKAFLAAVGDAVARIRAEPEATFDVFRKAYPETDNALNRKAWQLTLPYFATDPAALDPARYTGMAAFLKANGLIPEALPVARYAVRVE